MAAIGARSDEGRRPNGHGQCCGACRFFTGTPDALERAIPGLNILSSAYGSVRGDTGLCARHETFVTAVTPACPKFVKG
ncbi:MAG TPA: hypothetical protein VHY10_04575 [Xanthobacteraceae bacterium]|nr:hypothetical protein [Xanthobacteraceae bacterium]